jgi:ribulose-5-phosphate 4-epimerase/fuculose-1-phosphate aldolase
MRQADGDDASRVEPVTRSPRQGSRSWSCLWVTILGTAAPLATRREDFLANPQRFTHGTTRGRDERAATLRPEIANTMQPTRLTWLRVLSLVALGIGTVMLLAGSAATQQAASMAGLEEGAEKTFIDDLVIADHILAEQGVLDAFGHVSARDPKNPQRFLMSRSLAPALVKAEDVMGYDLDGNAVDPKGRTSFLERFIHSEIYRTRADVNAIVHSHTPAVIAFGTTQTPLRPITLLAAFLPQRVPVFEIRRAAGMTNMLVSSPQLGRALAETLGANSVALMRGHGMVVAASSLPLAVYRAVYTMVDARLETDAISLGGPVTFLEPQEAEGADKMLEQIHWRAWELWKREAQAHLCK